MLKHFNSLAGAPDVTLQSWEGLSSLPSYAYNALSFRPGKVLVWTDPAKVKLMPSQFVRRALNDAMEWPSPQFDWRAFPKLDNHMKTAEMLEWAGQFVERTAAVLAERINGGHQPLAIAAKSPAHRTAHTFTLEARFVYSKRELIADRSSKKPFRVSPVMGCSF